jgi:adenylate cyclase, class 2
MDIEYEATFQDVNKNDVRDRLKMAGAKLTRPEFLQKRATFFMPEGHEIEGGWLRVRDEGDKITLSLKVVNGDKIEDQKEIFLKVGDFGEAKKLLKTLGCIEKAFQESKRELWILDEVEVTIDEWPFLEPFVEVEGLSEDGVKKVSKKLGFSYEEAMFCSVDTLYSKKYNISQNIINNKTLKIIFSMENPFIE